VIVEPGLLDHPKFLRLERRLGEHALHILIRLWGHCQAEQRGERWRGADAEYVEAVVRWKGESGKASKDLEECGFVQFKEGVTVVHDWSEHNRSLISSWRNGRWGGRPTKKKTVPTGNPPITDGFPTGNPPITGREPVGPQRREEKRREEKMREDKTNSPTPPFVPAPLEVVVKSSVPRSFSDEERTQIEAIWSFWPKKRDTLHGQVAIGNAIRRDGYETVKEGTRKIVEAEAKTKSFPPGFYIRPAAEFFEGSKYFDDPQQYLPRTGGTDVPTLRRRAEDLQDQMKEHPGNPANTEGSLERKKEAREEFVKLRDALQEARQKLNQALQT